MIPKEDNGNLVNLFTYLPMSDTKYQLPYIVNGDFIPNLDRTNLIPTLEYNFRIAEFVAEELLKSCEKLSKTSQFEYLKKLIPTYELENNRYATTVKNHFIKEVVNHTIFPSPYSDNLVKLNNLIVDQTGLQNVLSETDYSNIFATQKKPLATNFGTTTEIEYLIEKTGQGSCFTVDDLKNSISSEQFQKWLITPEKNADFIKHIIENDELKDMLKESIFLTNFSALKKSAEIYDKQPDAIENFDVEILHSMTLPVINDESVKFKKYETLDFLDEVISTTEKEKVNKENLIQDWEWIFDNWSEIKEDNQRKIALRDKLILCKKGQNIEIQNTYVSDEFQIDDTNKIETIISSLQLEKSFISTNLISAQRPNAEWLKIFKELKAKANLQDVVTDIIENLNAIEDEQKHFKIGKEIFNYWNKKYDTENNLKDHLNSLQSNLKIKTQSQNYLIPSETTISDHYLTGTPHNDVLPTIVLQNGISDDYDKKGSNNNWFNFFKEILNCCYINQTQEVFDTKIEYYLQNQTGDKLRENHYTFLQDLDKIQNNNNSIILSKSAFKRMQLKDSDSVWRNPYDIYLPSSYQPKLDLQSDNAAEGISFLNDCYNEKKISKIFLLKIGVLQDFNLTNDEVRSADLSEDYRLFWSEKYNYIKNNAEPYGKQHRVENHISLILDIKLLEIYKYAKYFWESIFKTSYKAKLLNSQSTYRTAYSSYSDINFFIFSIQNMKCFPNRSKELCIPSELYSNKLKGYISNQEVLPLIDLSEIVNDNGQSVESAIGIQQSISQEIALALISNSKPELNKEDVGHSSIDR